MSMSQFAKVVLFTDDDGRARFREEAQAFAEGTDHQRHDWHRYKHDDRQLPVENEQ